jgi:Uma2 family endonuclease
MAASTTDAEYTEQSPSLDPEIVALLPAQGEWSDHDYLWLTDDQNRLVEWTDGSIEVLPMPTRKHQAILAYLFLVFHALMQRGHGKVLFAPLRLRVGPRKFREPDLLLVCAQDDPRANDRYWDGADLVVEVVSPDDPARDYKTKREDYAQVGVLEYWIVDPQSERITVLYLTEATYQEHGAFGRGAIATSVLFPELEVDVSTVLDQY